MPIGAEGFPSKSPWHLAGNSILPPRETDYIIKSAMEEWANTVAVWPTGGICVAGGQAQSIQSNDRASTRLQGINDALADAGLPRCQRRCPSSAMTVSK